MTRPSAGLGSRAETTTDEGVTCSCDLIGSVWVPETGVGVSSVQGLQVFLRKILSHYNVTKQKLKY